MGAIVWLLDLRHGRRAKISQSFNQLSSLSYKLIRGCEACISLLCIPYTGKRSSVDVACSGLRTPQPPGPKATVRSNSLGFILLPSSRLTKLVRYSVLGSPISIRTRCLSVYVNLSGYFHPSLLVFMRTIVMNIKFQVEVKWSSRLSFLQCLPFAVIILRPELQWIQLRAFSRG